MIEIAVAELQKAEHRSWEESQRSLHIGDTLPSWARQLDVVEGADGILWCCGRLGNADLPKTTRMQVLLNRKH